MRRNAVIMTRRNTVTMRWYVPEKSGRELSSEEEKKEEKRRGHGLAQAWAWESGQEGGRGSYLPGIASEEPEPMNHYKTTCRAF
jgi:hypothetical protein